MSGLFGGGSAPAAPPPPPQPILEQPAPMPIPDKDQQRQDALRQMVVSQAGKTTRRSTIIGDSETLG